MLPGRESNAGCREAEDAGFGLLSVDPPTTSGNPVLAARLSLLGAVDVPEFTVGKFVGRDGLILIFVRQGREEVEEVLAVPIGTVFAGSAIVLSYD